MVSYPRVFLDISINGENIGRIVLELFVDKAPKTSQNFRSLCLGNHSLENGNPLTFKGNYFHRVVKNFLIQCGDIINCSGQYAKTDETGKGGCSIFATKEDIENRNESELQCFGNFQDENLIDFDVPFLVAMANTGSANTNSSQFFVTTCISPHLNGKHSVFGRVIEGKSIVRTIEKSNVDSDGFPLECIKIEDSGDWDESMEVPVFNASNNTIGGDIYEEFPDDNDGMDSEDFTSALIAATTIKESGTLLYKKNEFKNAYFKYQKSLRYVNEYIPDDEVDRENNIKFLALKGKLYLNLSLVSLKLKNYDQAIKYSTFLLEMNGVPDKEIAKAFYRRGDAYLAKKRFENALQDYKSCSEKNTDDKAITSKIEYVEDVLLKQKEKTRQNISKFFSSS